MDEVIIFYYYLHTFHDKKKYNYVYAEVFIAILIIKTRIISLGFNKLKLQILHSVSRIKNTLLANILNSSYN